MENEIFKCLKWPSVSESLELLNQCYLLEGVYVDMTALKSLYNKMRWPFDASYGSYANWKCKRSQFIYANVCALNMHIYALTFMLRGCRCGWSCGLRWEWGDIRLESKVHVWKYLWGAPAWEGPHSPSYVLIRSQTCLRACRCCW